MTAVIVDANIMFSALISAGNKAATVLITPPTGIRLVSCHFIQIELFKHKERIKELSGLDDDVLIELLYEFSSHIEFINEAYIPFTCWQRAHKFLDKIDPNDTPYLALAIHLDAPLWTGDRRMKASSNSATTNSLLRISYSNTPINKNWSPFLIVIFLVLSA